VRALHEVLQKLEHRVVTIEGNVVIMEEMIKKMRGYIEDDRSDGRRRINAVADGMDGRFKSIGLRFESYEARLLTMERRGPPAPTSTHLPPPILSPAREAEAPRRARSSGIDDYEYGEVSEGGQ
jgi:hypothetical protein